MKMCRCGGENPTCYMCGGKGYLNESDLAPEPRVGFSAPMRSSGRRRTKGWRGGLEGMEGRRPHGRRWACRDLLEVGRCRGEPLTVGFYTAGAGTPRCRQLR